MATFSEEIAAAVRLHQAGLLSQAARIYEQLVERDPNNSAAWLLRGDVLSDLRKLEEAIICYRRAIELEPTSSASHYNLGTALKDLGRFEEASVCFVKALDLRPDFVEARFNLGYALQKQGALDAAVACYRRVLQDAPVFIEAYINLGNLLRTQQKLDEAADCFATGLHHNAGSADLHSYHAMVMLQKGDFERGWPEYEWRWKSRMLRPRQFYRPEWQDQPLQGKSILLQAEQGLGDTIQFVRYAVLVKGLGATVIFESHKQLLKLLSNFRGIDHLVAYGEVPPAYDMHVPLLNLPARFKTSIETIPGNVPYLFADETLIERWRNRLKDLPSYRIGINWRGGGSPHSDKLRNIPPDCFKALAELSHVVLISVQRGGRKDLSECQSTLPVVDFGEDLDQMSGAFMDTAAIMMNLDLVITSDTSVAHLAGALGVPVWVALPFAANWRWLLNRSDSPWYPTMRLFRQKNPGGWAQVFEEIKVALREHLRQ